MGISYVSGCKETPPTNILPRLLLDIFCRFGAEDMGELSDTLLPVVTITVVERYQPLTIQVYAKSESNSRRVDGG